MDANQPKTRRLTHAGGSPTQSSKRLTRSQTARKASSSGTRQAATKPQVNRAESALSAGTRAKRITRRASSTHGARRPSSAPSGAVRAEGPTFKNLQLRIHKVVCEKTSRELGKDEMTVAGIEAVAEVQGSGSRKSLKGKARKGKTVAVGKFRKGDEKVFQTPKDIANIPLGPHGGEWPRDFQAWVVMVESDEGALGKAVSAAVDAIDEKVVAYVSSAAATLATGLAAGAAIGSAVPLPLLGSAIGAVAGAATAAIANALKNAKKDDVFPVRTAKHTVQRYPSKAGELRGSRETLTFNGHGGCYKVVVSWAVTG